MKTHFFRAIIALAFVDCCISHAANNFSICESTYLERQSLESKEKLDRESRISHMETLHTELLSLNQVDLKSSGVPLSFLQNCTRSKLESFERNAASADSTGAASYRFNLVVAKIRELQKNYPAAQVYYQKASEADPSDYFSQQRSWRLWDKAQFSNLEKFSKSSISPKDFDDIRLRSKKLIEALVNNPKAPLSDRTEALNHWAEYLKLTGQGAQAMEQWKRVLALDPRNLKAMASMAQFEITRNRLPEARKLLESLAPQMPKEYLVQRELIALQLGDRDFNAAISTAKTASVNIPDRVDLKAQLAAAYQGLGRADEAENLNQQVLKKDPENKIARATESLIHEAKGDKWSGENLTGKAIAEYQLALNYKAENSDLREKMASKIYAYRRAQGLHADEATKKDLDAALNLIEKEVESDSTPTARLELFVLAAEKSSKPKRAAPVCDRYQKIFEDFKSTAIVVACVEAYRSANRPKKADEVLEAALKNPRFKAENRKLIEMHAHQ